jgi:hypothetical protein
MAAVPQIGRLLRLTFVISFLPVSKSVDKSEIRFGTKEKDGIGSLPSRWHFGALGSRAASAGCRGRRHIGMAQRFPRHHHSPEQWLRRLDGAADGMNPFLTTVANGLVILNLTCLALLATHLEVTRISPDGTVNLAAAD